MDRSGRRWVEVGRCAAIAVVVVAALLGVDPVATGALPSSSSSSDGGNGRATPSADWPMVGRGPGHAGFNPGERTIGAGNVSRLTTRWTAETWFGGDPVVVANGVAYLGSGGGRLHAFDARGSNGCSGAPRRCAPLWTAAVEGAGSPMGGFMSTPAVQNGLVYVTAGSSTGTRDQLYVFDAAGVRGCSGRPRVCQPRFRAVLGAEGTSSAPTVVASGVVYVGTGMGASRKVMAFDAKGVKGCSSTTRRCNPLWTARVGSQSQSASPAIAAADGMVYAATDAGDLVAFDAAGKKGCSGVPKTCAPVWRASDTEEGDLYAPAVADGVLYVSSGRGMVRAYDARGASGCAGTPKVCAPMWTATVGRYTFGSVAVAEGRVFVTAESTAGVGLISALDAKGVSGCSGTPKVCRALWSGRTANRPSIDEAPTVANGVVYLTTIQGRIQAFDARGSARCSGRPRTCAALWTLWTPGGYASSATIANGRVYLSNEKTFYAFGLP